MDYNLDDIKSIYNYLSQKLKIAKNVSDLIPFIKTLANIDHLKQFIEISLKEQYRIETKLAKTVSLHSLKTKPDKLRLLYLTLQSKQNNKSDSYETTHLQNIKSEPTIFLNQNNRKQTKSVSNTNKSIDIDNLLIETMSGPTPDISNASSDDDDDDENYDHDNDDDDSDETENEHGADFALAGCGPTTIIYTDNDEQNGDIDDDDDDDIKESQSTHYPSDDTQSMDESENSDHDNHNNNNNDIEQKQELNGNKQRKIPHFEILTHMKQIGEREGIIIKSQFVVVQSRQKNNNQQILMLAVQILNGNINEKVIKHVKIRFNKNCIGVYCGMSDIILPQQIGYNKRYEFKIPLRLDEEYYIMDKNDKFSQNVTMIIDTNLYEIECNLDTPIYFFFDGKREIERNEYLNLWKSIGTEKQCKVSVVKCRFKDIEQLKKILIMDIYKAYFIHHRVIPNKGDILYYASWLDGNVLLIEIAIASISNKGSVTVRGDDKFGAILCSNAIKLLIDTL